jgi:hypothetical protein
MYLPLYIVPALRSSYLGEQHMYLPLHCALVPVVGEVAHVQAPHRGVRPPIVPGIGHPGAVEIMRD